MTPFLQHLTSRGCITASPDTPLQQISKMMSDKRIGTVVICAGETVAGIVSERDIIRYVASHTTIAGVKAGDVMTTKLRTITPAITSSEIMEVMSTYKIRHLPIVEAGKLLGIVSITDVVNRLSEKTQAEAEMMRDFINS